MSYLLRRMVAVVAFASTAALCSADPPTPPATAEWTSGDGLKNPAFVQSPTSKDDCILLKAQAWLKLPKGVTKYDSCKIKVYVSPPGQPGFFNPTADEYVGTVGERDPVAGNNRQQVTAQTEPNLFIANNYEIGSLLKFEFEAKYTEDGTVKTVVLSPLYATASP